MRIYKKTLVKIFFAVEVVVFIGVYLYGGNGLQNLTRLQDENVKLESEIVELKTEVASLEQALSGWKSDDYVKEKFARENLQMAKEGDRIYFLK